MSLANFSDDPHTGIDDSYATTPDAGPTPVEEMTDREIAEETLLTMRAVLKLAETVADEVKPTLDGLKNNPMLKMFFRS